MPQYSLLLQPWKLTLSPIILLPNFQSLGLTHGRIQGMELHRLACGTGSLAVRGVVACTDLRAAAINPAMAIFQSHVPDDAALCYGSNPVLELLTTDLAHGAG